VKLHARTMAVAKAANEIERALLNLQEQHGLTDIEMLQTVDRWRARCLTGMLRVERHPKHECKADEACDRRGCPGASS
jgi:hypothetical protein